MGPFKSILKTILPLSIGVFFIYLSFKSTTAEDRIRIVTYFKNADIRFLILSVLFAVLSHISRAYRWQFLLQPMGYQPKLYNSIPAVLIAYLANLGVPRSGEIFRATTMTTYEKIPFEKGFGTIITERIIDLLLLAFCVIIALFLQFDMIYAYLIQKKIDLPVLLMGAFLFLSVVALVKHYLKNRQNSIVLKFKYFLRGLVEGILSIKKMPKKGRFVAHTIFIWTMYFAMFYVVKWCLPETATLTFSALFPAFVVGGLTISATNGGIGIYPYAVGMVLTAFDISTEAGFAFGWIMWSAQTLIILLFGGLSFFVLPLLNSKKEL